jgi:N,N'-diacetyllegionaminate synthase
VLKINVGYSDQSLGVEVPIAATAIGSTVIEKHFTLNKNFKGPDHKCSIEPMELAFMVKSIRNIEEAMGVKKKIVTASEKKNLEIVRKSICAKIQIQKGEKFSLNNLVVLRPGNGISPMKILKLIGTKAKYDFKKNQQIKL